MNSKEIFKEFCCNEKEIPLFLTYNWLETVAPDSWDVVIEERGGEIVAFMPYVLKKKFFFKYITIPPLTPYMGPWIKYPKGQKYTTKLSYEKEMLTLLISKLPRFDYFIQTFTPAITNWLPFYWAGFEQSTRYTYIIDDTSNLETIRESFSKNVRRHLNKAEEELEIIAINDIAILYNMIVKFYKESSIKMYYNMNYLNSIYQYVCRHQSGKLIAIKQGEKIIATHLYVYDNDTIYNLLGATDPTYKNSGAMTLIIWEGIKIANQMGLKNFDFEGSMVEPVERYFRDFGGKQTPYFKLSKLNSKSLSFYFVIKSLLNKK